MCPNYKVMPFLPVIFQELLFTDQQSKLPIQKNTFFGTLGQYEDDSDECSVEKRLKISEDDIGW
jgi:hypothetical protein